MSRLFASDTQNTGASASASVLPMSMQGWFPLRLTGLISLLSKGLSGVFSSTAVRRHRFFGICFLYGPTLTTVCDHWEDHSLDYMNLCQQSNVSAFQHSLGLSSLSCQEANVFWFNGCTHHLQWFWIPRKGNLSLTSTFSLSMCHAVMGPFLPLEKYVCRSRIQICMQVKNMKQWSGSKLGKDYAKAVYCHPAYLTNMHSTSWEMLGWMKHKLESRLLGEISTTSDMQMTPPLMAESKEKLKSLLMKVKEGSKKLV